MEKISPQNSSLMGTVSANDKCLFWPTSPNERMIQENIQKTPKGTQTNLMPPFSNSKVTRSNSEHKINAPTESRDSLVNASLYESFSLDESKYNSFDDSLDEEAHVSSKKINVSNFLSEQVNITVRKVRDRQKIKGSFLCDSLEDICSLVSNAEHLSTSDEIENINNILEKHGICEDSLRNDICHDNRNASLNEQNFDDDSLAILEVEKPFDDSLEDVDVVSCVDSLMILGSSIGDADVMVDKLVAENCGGSRNLFETSVQIIYENAPLSSEESFQTAENFNSNKNSLSLSDHPMSRDSLEEICDISEVASSEKSLNFPLKTAVDVNKVSSAEKTADFEGVNENVMESDIKRTSEWSFTSQNRFSNMENDRTSSIVNSCYFYDTFCIDDSMQLPSGFVSKESSRVIDIDSNCLDKGKFKPGDEVTEKQPESSNDCLSIPSNVQEKERNVTSENGDASSVTEYLRNNEKIMENETSQSSDLITALPSCNGLNRNTLMSHMKVSTNTIRMDSELIPLSPQNGEIESTSGPASKKECSQNNVISSLDESDNSVNLNFQTQSLHEHDLKIQVRKIDVNSLDHSSQSVFADESSKKVSLYDSVSYPSQRLVKNISTCSTVSPSLGKLAEHSVTAPNGVYTNELVENCSLDPKHKSDQMNLKVHIELAIHKNRDVNIVSISSKHQKTHNEEHEAAEKNSISYEDGTKTSALNNQTDQFETGDSKNEIDAFEKIITEVHKKIPTIVKLSEYENSGTNKLISLNKTFYDVKIKLDMQDNQLLQALDLHDNFDSYRGEGHIESRDSIMPLNLCIRDMSPEKRNKVLLMSKENIPCAQKGKNSSTISKGAFIHSKNKHFTPKQDFKKPGKPCLMTKIPIRKADSPLSVPLNLKQIKQDFKISPCGGKHTKSPIVKSISVDSISKTSSEEMPRKHHFCTVRNSICRVPKSLEKPNAKKFQSVQSPVAKYIGNAKKVQSPLKTTHRYDGNFISTPPFRTTSKAASSSCVITPEVSITKKAGKKSKS